MDGQIRTAKRLTGKGRSDPYEIKIRAEDNGEPGMFTDVKLSLYISDIIENDGVPTFVHPTVDEIAYVSEVRRMSPQNRALLWVRVVNILFFILFFNILERVRRIASVQGIGHRPG